MIAKGRGILDPTLTETGRSQAEELRKSVVELGPFDAVVTSPMTRALQTTAIAIESLDGVPILVTSLHTETGISVDGDDVAGQPCQRGSSLESLREKFPHMDFSPVEQDAQWISADGADGFFHPSTADERTTLFTQWLQELPFARVLVIGHSGFFKRYLAQDVKMGNCEIVERPLPT